MIRGLLLACLTAAWNYQQEGADWTGTCASGKSQSPINIDTGSYSTLGSTYSMQVYYYGQTASRTVSNNGDYIYIEADLGYITVTDESGNNRQFNVDWVEFHYPSEHWFDGNDVWMEVEIFHTIQDSDYTVDFPTTAVVSVPIRPGDESFFMDSIDVWNLPAAGESNVLPGSSNINLLAIVDTNDDYFFYNGSLNKPTCDQNVLWYVYKTQQWVSLAQMANFEALWVTNLGFSNGKGNVRKIQPMNGRTLYFSATNCLVYLTILMAWLL